MALKNGDQIFAMIGDLKESIGTDTDGEEAACLMFGLECLMLAYAAHDLGGMVNLFSYFAKAHKLDAQTAMEDQAREMGFPMDGPG